MRVVRHRLPQPRERRAAVTDRQAEEVAAQGDGEFDVGAGVLNGVRDQLGDHRAGGVHEPGDPPLGARLGDEVAGALRAARIRREPQVPPVAGGRHAVHDVQRLVEGVARREVPAQGGAQRATHTGPRCHDDQRHGGLAAGLPAHRQEDRHRDIAPAGQLADVDDHRERLLGQALEHGGMGERGGGQGQRPVKCHMHEPSLDVSKNVGGQDGVTLLHGW
jgi:hypothetical protein